MVEFLKELFINRQRRPLLLAGCTVLLLLLGLIQRHEERLDILVASRLLPAGTVLQEPDLAIITVPSRLLPGGVIFPHEADAIINKKLVRLVGHNEILAWSALEGTSLRPSSTIPAGKRFVAFTPNNLTTMLPFLTESDRLDLIWLPEAGIQAGAKSYLLMQNVAIHSLFFEEEVSFLGLALNLKDAVTVNHAVQHGSIDILLRHPNDEKRLKHVRSMNNADVLRRLQKKGKNQIEIIYGKKE